jgi:beta-glucosidase/6-phospho-beta-glucosidase/beta-galactosidase
MKITLMDRLGGWEMNETVSEYLSRARFFIGDFKLSVFATFNVSS